MLLQAQVTRKSIESCENHKNRPSTGNHLLAGGNMTSANEDGWIQQLSGNEPTEWFLDVVAPVAPLSPYHLVYETLAQEPWKVLIASVLMKRVNTATGRCMVVDFFTKFPTLKSINFDKMVDFFKVCLFIFWHSCLLRKLICSYVKQDVGSVPMVNVLSQDIEAIATNLLARSTQLEDVPHITAYSCQVFSIFCLQQFRKSDIKDFYDLKSYVRWRLANN